MSKQRKYRYVEPIDVGTPFTFNIPKDKVVTKENGKITVSGYKTAFDKDTDALTTYPEVTITGKKPDKIDKNALDEYNYSKLGQPPSITPIDRVYRETDTTGLSPNTIAQIQYAKDINDVMQKGFGIPSEILGS